MLNCEIFGFPFNNEEQLALILQKLKRFNVKFENMNSDTLMFYISIKKRSRKRFIRCKFKDFRKVFDVIF